MCIAVNLNTAMLLLNNNALQSCFLCLCFKKRDLKEESVFFERYHYHLENNFKLINVIYSLHLNSIKRLDCKNVNLTE